MTTHCLRSITVALMWLAVAASARADAFIEPVCITDHLTSPARRRMSANTQGQLLRGVDGALKLVYWEGGPQTTPDTPSRVWFTQWTDATGWSARERVDRSQLPAPDGREIGGRHPAMAERADGALFAAWHDHRHCLPSNYINNLEIYGNTRPTTATWATTDTRLSETPSGNAGDGDNGYAPQTVVRADGRIAVAWYDYHWSAFQSEICLRLSDTDGAFGAPGSIDAARLTQPADRASGDSGEDFIMPTLAADTSGTIHLAWSTGRLDTTPALYYGRYDADGATWLEKGRLRDDVGGFDDPARLVADPATGDVWLVYRDHSTTVSTTGALIAERRRLGASAFDPWVALTGVGADPVQPCAAVDHLGRLHVAYVDKASPSRQVKYVVYDPAGGVVSSPETVTDSPHSGWARPALALDDADRAYVVWERELGVNDGELWFATNRHRNAARHWRGYR